jgi:hypothetical protein
MAPFIGVRMEEVRPFFEHSLQACGFFDALGLAIFPKI